MKRFGRKLGKGEEGFTLPEVLVTIMMMVMVLFALYSVFDMGIRVFAFGNNKLEAVENARLGLEKMAREIRAAYPVDVANDDTYLFFEANGATSNPTEQMPQTSRITFGNELGNPGDREITCGSPCEYVTYKLVGNALMRNATATGSTSSAGDQPVIEFVNPGGPNGGLNFTYLGSNGDPCGSTNPTCDGTDQADIDRVRITLDIRVQDGQQNATQTLTTDVDLRNQGITSAPSAPPSEPPPPPDTTPPVVTITSGPSGTVTSTSATFEFTSNEEGSTFECRLDGGAWGACTSPRSYTGLSSGSHTFEVRATDAASNTSSPASRTWTISPPADTTPPVITITSGPSGTVTSSSATFAFTANEPSTFECRLDSGAWTSCTSPRSYTGLSAGSHTFSVRATDAAGNTSSSVSRTWTVNRPPVANNDSGSARSSGPPPGRRTDINVLANDSDPDGDPLTIVSFTQPSSGSVTQVSGNTLRYTSAGSNGTFTFTYTISDGRGGTATATVTITVTN